MGKNYTARDKKCPHCGGDIEGHSCGNKVVYWCKNCGSNSKNCQPRIVLTQKECP